jgi:putative salt-induced outer membrane protein YdiY
MASRTWLYSVLTASVAGFLFAAAPASADVIALNNGDRITGTIDKITPDAVEITTPYAGKITLKPSAIRSMASTHTVGITDAAGATHNAIVGPTADNTGWKEVAAAPAHPDAIVVPYVAAPVTPPAPAPAVSLFGPKWQNQLALGFLNLSGNTSQTEFTGEASFHYTDKPHELTLKFDGAYGTTNGVQDNSSVSGDIVYRHELANWHPHDHWFLFGESHDLYDGIKGISFRSINAVGLGNYLWRGKKAEVDVRAGPGFLYEKYFSGDQVTNVTALAGLRATYKLSDRVILSEDFVYNTSVSDNSNYQITSITAADVKLPDVQRGFGLKVAFEDDYDNAAGGQGSKQNDTRFVVALTLDY